MNRSTSSSVLEFFTKRYSSADNKKTKLLTHFCWNIKGNWHRLQQHLVNSPPIFLKSFICYIRCVCVSHKLVRPHLNKYFSLNQLDTKIYTFSSVQFSPTVVSDSATPWTAAHQASLSIINSRSLPKLSSFTFIKRLFSSSPLYAIRVVSSASEVVDINGEKSNSRYHWIASISQHIRGLQNKFTSKSVFKNNQWLMITVSW